MSKIYKYPCKVYYEDTDALGVVYHSNYLKYMERARSQWLHDEGYSLHRVMNELKVLFVVSNIDISYKKPARLEDNLFVVSTVTKVGKASITYNQIISFDDAGSDILCDANIKIVCCNMDLKPEAIPEGLIKKLKGLV